MQARQSLAWVSGGIALALSAAWIVYGLPTTAHDPANIDALPVFKLMERIFQKAGWGTLPFFLLLTSTSLLSASLGLVIALRAKYTEAALDLALALCLAAAFLVYVFILPLLPWAEMLDRNTLLVYVTDALALAALVWAAHLYLRFWLGYPRALSKEEVLELNWDKTGKQLRNMWAWRKRMYLRGRDEAAWIEEQRLHWASLGSRMLEFLTSRRGLMIQLGMAMIVAVLWRPGWHAPVKSSDMRGLLSLFSLIPLYMLLTTVGIQIAGIVRFHRDKGSAEEARKVEWIRASYLVILVLLAVPINLIPLWMVFGFLGGEPAVMWMIKHNAIENSVYAVMLAFMASPLIYLMALGASIFARGTIDPKLAVRGFTLWTLLGLILTFFFVLIERAVAIKVVEVFKLPPESGAVVAGAIIAATFIPIRRVAEKWVMRWVERFMPATLLASGERKEVAVVLIDITGYSALSARDEHSAVIATTLLQKECRHIADLRGGRVIKSTGDGALLAFDKAEDAALAVREIHAAYATGSAALSLPELSLHSGAHWGEVVELRDGDIYGQTVNTTARIADFAKAGEIMLSGAFAARLNLEAFTLTSVGPQKFKNLPEPVECVRLA